LKELAAEVASIGETDRIEDVPCDEREKGLTTDAGDEGTSEIVAVIGVLGVCVGNGEVGTTSNALARPNGMLRLDAHS